MVRVRPDNIELIKLLTGFHKPYFTVADLERILGLGKKSLLVTLTRLVKSGVLVRLRQNAYLVYSGAYEIEKAANQLYFPSYLSFETALSRHGILSQTPYTLTFATVRPSKKMKVGDIEAEYSHIKNELYFGYETKGGICIAEPEKALLDELYMIKRGLRNLNLEELDLKEINKGKLKGYAEKFPSYINSLLIKVEKYVGSTPVTNDNKERIVWDESN